MTALVLWGHQLKDYREMFDLTDNDISAKILEYGSGPTAVNNQLTALGRDCTSCDPLFCLDNSLLDVKTSLVFAEMVDELKTCPKGFNFSAYGSMDNFIAERRQGMRLFFTDYPQGLQERRYVGISQVKLNFPDSYFAIALSSHYFFAGLEEQDEQFHIAALSELLRVAHEVRVFPVIDRQGTPSPLLGPVLLHFQRLNYGVEVRAVPYHLQQNGNAMLRIWAKQCPVNVSKR